MRLARRLGCSSWRSLLSFPCRCHDFWLFLGTDADGVMLEVVAIERETDWLVVHAMLLRNKYRHYLEE